LDFDFIPDAVNFEDGAVMLDKLLQDSVIAIFFFSYKKTTWGIAKPEHYRVPTCQ
jgi:hypothetical protein